MGTTPINNIPYPDGPDAPDITAEFAAAAAAIDHWTVKRFANAAERDGIHTSPLEGEIAFLSDGGGVMYNGDGWVTLGQTRTLMKTAVETTTATTLQDDNHLQLFLGKNGMFDIEVFLIYSSNTTLDAHALIAQLTSTSTVQMAAQFTTVQFAAETPINIADHETSFNSYTTNLNIGLGGDANKKFGAKFNVLYTTGAIDETFKVQWCAHPDGDPGSTGSVHVGSYMRSKRVSIVS